MPLRLTVANSAGETPVVERTKEFDHRGGTIGRADDNTWVLPDKVVSGLHAEIESRGDEFWIIDRSTNGTFVDDAEDPIGKGREQRLDNGARLRIGHYEIAVVVVAKEPQRRSAPQGSAASGLNGVVPTADIFTDFPDKPERPTHPEAWPSQPNRGRPERQNFRPRPITPPPEHQREHGGDAQPGGLIPPDFANRFKERKKGGGRAPPAEVLEPVSSPRVRKHREVDPEPENAQRRHSADAGVASMLEAAGLDRDVARAAASDSALVAELGRALAIAVRSVLKTLDTRADIKHEFGLPVTEYRAESNNPLKCSETVKEALDRLVLRENSPYMGPYEAFEEAAKDISEHQVAVIAAMRSAFKSMLAEFEPQALERRYEEQNKQAALLKMGGGKGRYWDLYREHYQRVAGDSRTSFQKLFGQQFATAYWEALKGGRS